LAVSTTLLFGLTGGIGSGKSTAGRIFSVLGVPVYDADAAARRIMNEDAGLKLALVQEFGTEVYNEKGLNRAYLAAIVFNDAARLEKLNALVHPLTIADAANWAARQTTPYVIKEAALMFESNSFQQVEAVIGVSAPQAMRLHRVMQRDGATREEVLKRMERQIPEAVKMKLCDYVLINDEQQLLTPQVVDLHRQLLQRCQQK
jgi:dephospho-CoA kinase